MGALLFVKTTFVFYIRVIDFISRRLVYCNYLIVTCLSGTYRRIVFGRSDAVRVK